MSDDQTALDRLIALVPPPIEPAFGAGGWEELAADMGLRFHPCSPGSTVRRFRDESGLGSAPEARPTFMVSALH
ncbi:hypothetical protein [Streptosporangium lutulentum]|uniref:Uncharacterized protein n=1 Tax=Streptosporangium lutulentum TaxID=1461250 RepID=A0ABT9QLT0_9ACTN|nr:hypothetical protein [Streptosporangium lutulentum]MDP9847710.1 hypothetical protein [Streptosporangium lutulentum]